MAFPMPEGDPTSPPSQEAPAPHKGHPTQEWKNYPKNKITLPTIGRVIYYHIPGMAQPLAAIVASVLQEGYTVNLGVLMPDGRGFAAVDVPHASQATPGQAYWDWMDYQKGQAAKTERLQEELEKLAEATKARPVDEKNAKIDPNRGTSFSGQGATGAIDESPPKK